MLKNYTEIYKDGTYLNNNPTWDAEDSEFKANKILQLLNKHNIPLDSICEVGCGSGEILVQLSSHLPSNTKFLGFDISADAINIAKKKETTQIKFELKDITDVSLNQPFDLVLIMDVIEHVENYFDFLRALTTKSRYKSFISLLICVPGLSFVKKCSLNQKKESDIYMYLRKTS